MDLFNVALQAIHAPIYIKYGGAVDTALEVKWRDVLEFGHEGYVRLLA